MTDEEPLDFEPGADVPVPAPGNPELEPAREPEPESAPPGNDTVSPPPKVRITAEARSSFLFGDPEGDEAKSSGGWAYRNEEFQRLRSEGMRAFGYDVPGRTVIENLSAGGHAAVGDGAKQINYDYSTTNNNTNSSTNTNNIYYGLNQRVTARAGRITTTTANSATYVRFPRYPAARHALYEMGVVYLCGALGSGRWSTAIDLGVDRCGPDRVLMVDLDDGFDLAALVDEGRNSVLLKGHAHVIELDANRPVRKSTLATLGSWAVENKACVIVIGPPATKLDHSLEPYAVLHDRPDPKAVLFNHLRHGLSSVDEAPPDFVRTCLEDEDIAEYLGKPLPPWQVAKLARRLIEGIDQGREPREALSLIGTQLREVATRVLVAIEATGSFSQLRKRHREIAARLAYAVFQDHTMTEVSAAAGMLYEELRAGHQSTLQARNLPVFGLGIFMLLGHDMRNLVHSGAADDEERRAKLVDPSLAQHLLDVAWNDFDLATREPLMAWLDKLVDDGRHWMVLRAAMTVGYLATHDFSVLYRRLIRPWAVSDAYRRRQAAAWALDFAALNRKLTSRVARQVGDWALSTNHLMNETAALAYATAIGAGSIENTLSGLRAIAMHPLLMNSASVAGAITALYQPEHASSVLRELMTWAGAGRETQVHAARSVVFLSSRNAPNGLWPALVQLAAADPDAREQVRSLWRLALTVRLTSKKAWDALLHWMLRGDHDAELGVEIKEFVVDLLRAPDFAGRARFTLRIASSQYPGASLLKQIIREL